MCVCIYVCMYVYTYIYIYMCVRIVYIVYLSPSLSLYIICIYIYIYRQKRGRAATLAHIRSQLEARDQGELHHLRLSYVPQLIILHFSICACHPCAGAMLIFSVSFQF